MLHLDMHLTGRVFSLLQLPYIQPCQLPHEAEQLVLEVDDATNGLAVTMTFTSLEAVDAQVFASSGTISYR